MSNLASKSKASVFDGTKAQEWDVYDSLLNEVKPYCHPDVPIEIVVQSKDPIHFSKHHKSVMKELYDESRKNGRISIIMELDGRQVELIRNPVMNARLTVIIHRKPKDEQLTFREAKNILKEVEKILGIEIKWGRPFPRGSC